ncbi:15359_t:CDS:2 [Cetraspora pellucida]|uniref:15359_t:CDS:1 n=1 Tax=Cetraspora pellucida TaxID=1433469 RepID=A0A9N9B5Q7_9GLOM|nr:15359_t:CDS:2 [Cetraspora pellucida]
MSESNLSAQISETKKCSDCHVSKKRQNFCRLRNNNPQYEHVTCNMCSERHSKKRQETNSTKKTKVDTDLNVIVPSISTSLSRNNNASDFLQVDNIINDNFEQILEAIEIEEHNIPGDENDDNNNSKALSYCMDENAESSEESTKFALEIKLDSKLLNSVELDQNIETDLLDLNKIKNSFIQLVKTLILSLETGSRYYWNITTEEGKDQITRRSKSKIIINMNVQLQCASVQCKHLCAHEQPSYWQIEFPEKAKKWIQENYYYHLRSSELYLYLMDNNLIHTIHMKKQTYLEQSELMARGFKIISYFDNHFIQALGFITPLFNRIGAQNINEILFVVNANCGGYGMPLAYLYLLTSSNLETVHHYSSDGITTRVQVLQRFFASLHQERLLPSFVLLNKDADEISVINKKPWSNTYSKQKALEAHQLFDFIDPLWFQTSSIKTLCLKNEAKEIVNIIKCHANMHPLIPIEKNIFWTMPLARTTIITESHWRVLKYNYKYNYNRPQLDHLTNILAEQLIPDFDLKLAQYNAVQNFSSWWQAFKKD